MSGEPCNTLQVGLGDRAYPILFSGEDPSLLSAQLAETIGDHSSLGLIADGGLPMPLALPAEVKAPLKLERTLACEGERLKCFAQLEELVEAAAGAGLDRHSALLAYGGGVIGDLVGVTAATYLRGIAFYQFPTTLLAMVDASVGGKTGINLKAGKNLFGAFHQPRAVFVHRGFLQSLPAREFAAGMAEVIKYGLLADSALYEQLLSAQTLDASSTELDAVIRRCCEIKAQIVADDERETAKSGGRALLNLGHTFAHAIENVAGYGEYLHGEAVAIGLVLAARLSQRLGRAESMDVAALEALLQRYDLPVRLGAPLPLEDLMAAMLRDKKVRAGTIRFVILAEAGEAITHEGVDQALVRELWQGVGAEA